MVSYTYYKGDEEYEKYTIKWTHKQVIIPTSENDTCYIYMNSAYITPSLHQNNQQIKWIIRDGQWVKELKLYRSPVMDLCQFTKSPKWHILKLGDITSIGDVKMRTKTILIIYQVVRIHKITNVPSCLVSWVGALMVSPELTLHLGAQDPLQAKWVTIKCSKLKNHQYDRAAAELGRRFPPSNALMKVSKQS